MTKDEASHSPTWCLLAISRMSLSRLGGIQPLEVVRDLVEIEESVDSGGLEDVEEPGAEQLFPMLMLLEI